MGAFGAYLWAEVDDVKERRSRMKMVTNGFDMDSKLDAWAKKFGNPHNRTLKGRKEWRFTDGGASYSLEEYWREQQQGTAWMSARQADMIEMIQDYHARTARTEKKRPELTAKSYTLQSIEACSREAKLAWCARNGFRVMSLQHDGVLVAGGPSTNWAILGRALTGASRLACGYRTEVEVKPVPQWQGIQLDGAHVVN